MDRQQFDDAIGAVPPSTVDVDAVVARQRRAAVLRRGGPGLVAAAAVVAVTFGVAFAVPGGSGGGDPGGGMAPGAESTAPRSDLPSSGQLPSSTPRPPGVPDPCAKSDVEPAPGDPADIAARLQAVLDTALRGHLPNAQLTANPISQYRGRRYGPLEFMHVYEPGKNYGSGSCVMQQDYYLARAVITDPAGTGNLTAMVGTAEGSFRMPCSTPESFTPEQVFCQERTGPGGEEYTVSTLKPEGGATVHRVDLVKPDGTMIILDSQNVADDIKSNSPVTAPDPPLTLDQLVAIALTPGLTLYP